MERRPYSAGAVKFSFWFMEFRKTVQLLAEGKSFSEIKDLNEKENIYAASTKVRAKLIYSTVTARIKMLNPSFYADGILPITDEEYLEDDIVARLCTWLKVVYGEDTLEENLDFIAKALGKKGDSSREIIRKYFLEDFFKDLCQTYSVTGSGKRPIYWLFDSGK